MSGSKIKWKDIPGYEGYYRVSDIGIIASCTRYIKRKSKTGRTEKVKLKGYILRPKISKDDYVTVNLNKNGKKKKVLIHRIVLLAFEGPPPEGHHVKHKDFNSLNNMLENLMYVTKREVSKMTTEKVKQLRQLKKEGLSFREIAEKFNISHTQVGRIYNKENWDDI